ncbi:MAG: SHOCT domain-containing protein, partial [Nitrosopumilus sp.]
KHKLVDDVTREKSDEIIQHAKKKGYEISEMLIKKTGRLKSKLRKGTKLGVQKSIKIKKKLQKPSKQKHLDLLKKLGELKKAGVITDKEFQVKKKKILAKI